MYGPDSWKENWRLKTEPTIGPRGYPVLTDEVLEELKQVRAGYIKEVEKPYTPSESGKEQAREKVYGVCTGVLSRLEQAKNWLNAFLAQEDIRLGVVLVDYGCPEGTADWVRRNIKDERVLLVQVLDPLLPGKFCTAHCWNVGIKHIKGELGMLISVDVYPVHKHFLLEAAAEMIDKNALYSGIRRCHKKFAGAAGTILFYKWLWEAVNGYEEFRNDPKKAALWGSDDSDIWHSAYGRVQTFWPGRHCKFNPDRVEVMKGGTKKYTGRQGITRFMEIRREKHIWWANLDAEPPGTADVRLWSPGLGEFEDVNTFWERIKNE